MLRFQNEGDKEHLQYCSVCEGYKAPRSHHCRKCGKCVMKMDHHCPWLNCVRLLRRNKSSRIYSEYCFYHFQCVGWNNHAYFTAFLVFSVIGCIQSTIILGGSFWNGIHRSWSVRLRYAKCIWFYSKQATSGTLAFSCCWLTVPFYLLPPHSLRRYIYSGLGHLATVNFGVTSLILCIFNLGLSVGVVVAVGMLLFFQVCVWAYTSGHIRVYLIPFVSTN